MFKLNKVVSATLLAVMTLSGCATTRISGEVEKSVDAKVDIVDKALKEVSVESKKVPLVEHDKGVWLGGHSTPIVKQVVLPEIFNREITFERSVTLQEAASAITGRYGIPIKIAKEVATPAGSATSTPGAAPLPTAPGVGAAGTNSATAKISYTGKLSGLLDILASRYTAHWKYKEGVIQFFAVDTRTFTIKAVPGDTSTNSQVNNSSSTSSGGGSSSGGSSSGGSSSGTGGSMSSTTANSTLSVWNGLKDSITAMLSAAGKVVVSPATGTVTVTDTPEILDRVSAFVDDQNESLSRQVSFDVKVYSVSVSAADNYQINWNFVYKTLNQNYGFNIKNNFPSTTGSTSIDYQILSGATGGVSRFAGSDVMLNALSTQGKTSLLTSATVTTLNAQPVPVQVARNTSYLQSVSTTVTANVGTTSTLTPGTFTTGFSMNMLPNILSNGSLMVRYSIDLSVLNKLSTISSGSSTIQTPEIDTRNFLQHVTMNSGETVVLTGFEQNTNNLQNSGVGAPKNALLGGGVDANKNRDVVVVAITPVISAAR